MLELSAPWEWIQPRQLRGWTETVFSQSTEGQDKEGPLLTVGCSWTSRIDLCCFTPRKSHKKGEVKKKMKSVWFPLHNQLQLNESLGQEVSYETFQNRWWDCTKWHWFLCLRFLKPPTHSNVPPALIKEKVFKVFKMPWLKSPIQLCLVFHLKKCAWHSWPLIFHNQNILK